MQYPACTKKLNIAISPYYYLNVKHKNLAGFAFLDIEIFSIYLNPPHINMEAGEPIPWCLY